MKPHNDLVPRLLRIPLLAGALALAGCGVDDAGPAPAGDRPAAAAESPVPAETADLTVAPGAEESPDGVNPADEPGAGDAHAAGDDGTGSNAVGSGAPAAERTSPPGTGDAPAPDPAVGTPEPQETVEDVLRATARRYEGVRALQAEFEQHLTNTLLGRTTRSTGMLYQRQPDRFLMRFTDPAGDVIVSDGTYFWLYYPSSDPRQVIRSERGAGGLDLQSQFVGDPVRRFEATSHGTETVRGRSTHVITLMPREPMGYRRLKVWIDAEDHLVRRFELTEDNGNVRRFELTDLRINPSLPDDLFRFEPPAGAVVVTR